MWQWKIYYGRSWEMERNTTKTTTQLHRYHPTPHPWPHCFLLSVCKLYGFNEKFSSPVLFMGVEQPKSSSLWYFTELTKACSRLFEWCWAYIMFTHQKKVLVGHLCDSRIRNNQERKHYTKLFAYYFLHHYLPSPLHPQLYLYINLHRWWLLYCGKIR